MKPQPPKYTALYRVFDIRKTTKKAACEKIVGSNKEKLRREIYTKMTAERPILWAIYDNSSGECVSGGIVAARKRATTIWGKRYIKDIAPRFFNV